LELAAFQEEVARLTDSWSDAKLVTMNLLLTEEIGELARAIRKLGTKRWGHEDESVGSKDNIVEELGDILWLLARISIISDVSLAEAAATVLRKIELRVAQSG
jgi:NTP pyrophosphatase (non-canonical NTP hydrolase)